MAKKILPYILSMVLFTGMFIYAGMAEADDNNRRNGTVTMEATISTVITLSDGNTFVTEVSERDVTVNTYNSVDPDDWEIVY